MKSSALRISLLVVLILSATAVLAAPPQQTNGAGTPVVTPAPVEGPIEVAPPPFTLEGTDLARMLRRQATVMTIPGRGGMRLDLNGGFRSVLVMRVTAEGKLETACVITEKAAERILAPKPERTRQEP